MGSTPSSLVRVVGHELLQSVAGLEVVTGHDDLGIGGREVVPQSDEVDPVLRPGRHDGPCLEQATQGAHPSTPMTTDSVSRYARATNSVAPGGISYPGAEK